MVFLILALVVFLDQTSKFFITRTLTPQHSLPVIKGIFHLTLVHNRGAAFGILKDQLFLFIIVTIAAIVMIILSLKEKGCRKIQIVSLSLILAGSIGNLVDRIFFGYVIDFLDFRVWPVFNIADSAISIGAVLLGYLILRGDKA
jgi:signal peptidase II